jgi:oligopeptide transport system substrate-binding protein
MKQTLVFFHSKKKKFTWQVILLCLLAGGCFQQKPSPHLLRISLPSSPTTLDPTHCGDFVSSSLVCLLYEGLTRCLPDGSVEPALAERIEISSDQTVYTFHLRAAYWNNGQKVTAYDFERSWKQALDLSNPSVCAYLFYPIFQAEAAVQKRVSLEEVGIKALNAGTFQVRLEKPTPHFLSLTAFPSFLPALKNPKTTNGPFSLEKIDGQSEIVLLKNPTFWNAKAIELEGIQISIIPDENAAWKMFERGEIDWLGGALSPVPWEAFEGLATNPGLSFDSMAASTFCVFNTADGLFANIHFRRAFQLAIDREQIAEQTLHGTQIVPVGCIPPSLWGESPPNILPSFDPTLAREELRKGCEEMNLDPAALGPIHLHLRTSYIDRILSQILQWQWKEVLGVEIVVHQSDTKTLKQQLHKRQYQVALTNWIAQYHDPLNILERFKTKANPKNYPGWEDARFTELVEKAERAVDELERRSSLVEAEKLLVERAVIAPIYHWRVPSLRHLRVQNMHTTPSGGVLFEKSKLVD